jgi:hypothetical protein
MNLISNIGKAIRTLGVMGIMLALAGFAVSSAPSASAASAPTSVRGDYGALSVTVDFLAGASDRNVATVVVQNRNGKLIDKGTTNSDGTYTVKLMPDAYKITVTADGYKSYSQTVRVTSSQTSEVKVALESSSGPTGRR